jgi:hypothetical protein
MMNRANASAMRSHVPTRQLAIHDLRGVAYRSETDPRTVRRVISGLPTRDLPRSRIIATLVADGLAHLLPDGEVERAGGR